MVASVDEWPALDARLIFLRRSGKGVVLKAGKYQGIALIRFVRLHCKALRVVLTGAKPVNDPDVSVKFCAYAVRDNDEAKSAAPSLVHFLIMVLGDMKKEGWCKK